MFAVLSNKDESTYTFLLPELQTSAAGSVMLDFEKATMKPFNTMVHT